MGKVDDGIEPRLRTFIDMQPVFFVATAPLAADGHVNLSPKGRAGTLAVLDEHTVAPKILRIHGVANRSSATARASSSWSPTSATPTGPGSGQSSS